MSSATDSVKASLIEDDSMVCIHNVRFNDEGRDMGGKIHLDLESIEWLIDSLKSFLQDSIPQSKVFTHDDLEVKFSGPQYQPRLAIYSRRSPQAKHGGTTAETMNLDIAPSLITELEALIDSLKSN